MASKKQVYWTSEEGLEIIAGWKRKGLTDAQVCKNLEINRSTLYRWCDDSEELCNTLKINKEISITLVENALFKKAVGFTKKIKKDMVGKDGEIVTYESELYFPPDITAIKFYLTNRDGSNWKDKQVQETNLALQEDDPITKAIKESFKIGEIDGSD